MHDAPDVREEGTLKLDLVRSMARSLSPEDAELDCVAMQCQHFHRNGQNNIPGNAARVVNACPGVKLNLIAHAELAKQAGFHHGNNGSTTALGGCAISVANKCTV